MRLVRGVANHQSEPSSERQLHYRELTGFQGQYLDPLGTYLIGSDPTGSAASPADTTWRLVHPSLGEWLRTKNSNQLSSTDGHRMLAGLILRRLTGDDAPKQSYLWGALGLLERPRKMVWEDSQGSRAPLSGRELVRLQFRLLEHLTKCDLEDKEARELLRKNNICFNDGQADLPHCFCTGSALHLTAYEGTPEMMALLLSLPGRLVDPTQAPKGSMTALAIAASRGRVETVRVMRKYLTAAAVDSTAGGDGLSALHVAAQLARVDIVKVLFEPGSQYKAPVDPNLPSRSEGEPALHIAARLGHHRMVRELLRYEGVKRNKYSKQGLTALLTAVRKQKRDVVQVLLRDEEVDPNKGEQHTGRTPLSRAAIWGDWELVGMMLGFPKVASSAGQLGSDKMTTLMHVVESNGMVTGTREVLRLLLECRHIDPNMVDGRRGNTALHLAARRGNLWAVKVLLSVNGIDLSISNAREMTPMQLARHNGHDEVAAELDRAAPDLGPEHEVGSSASAQALEEAAGAISSPFEAGGTSQQNAAAVSANGQRTQPPRDNGHNEEVAVPENTGAEVAGAEPHQLRSTAARARGELQGAGAISSPFEVGGMSQHGKSADSHLV